MRKDEHNETSIDGYRYQFIPAGTAGKWRASGILCGTEADGKSGGKCLRRQSGNGCAQFAGSLCGYWHREEWLPLLRKHKSGVWCRERKSSQSRGYSCGAGGKDAVGTKGAVLTRNISFAGKFLALLPNEGGEIGVSRKITNEAERRRMQEIMEELLPSDCGAIVRTNGAGRSKEEFQKELESLLQKWQSVKQAEYRKAPAFLWQENIPVLKAARDFYSADLDSVVVNDKETYELLAATGDFSREGQPKLELYEEKHRCLLLFMRKVNWKRHCPRKYGSKAADIWSSRKRKPV